MVYIFIISIYLNWATLIKVVHKKTVINAKMLLIKCQESTYKNVVHAFWCFSNSVTHHDVLYPYSFHQDHEPHHEDLWIMNEKLE